MGGAGRVVMTKLGEEDGVRDKTRKLHKNQRVENLSFYSAGNRATHGFDLMIRRCPQVMEEMTRPWGCRLKYLLRVYLEKRIAPFPEAIPLPRPSFCLKGCPAPVFEDLGDKGDLSFQGAGGGTQNYVSSSHILQTSSFLSFFIQAPKNNGLRGRGL